MDATFRRGLANPMEQSLSASSTLLSGIEGLRFGEGDASRGSSNNEKKVRGDDGYGSVGGAALGGGEFGLLAQQRASWEAKQAATAAARDAASLRQLGSEPAGVGFEDHPSLAAHAVRAMAAQNAIKMGNLDGSLEEIDNFVKSWQQHNPVGPHTAAQLSPAVSAASPSPSACNSRR